MGGHPWVVILSEAKDLLLLFYLDHSHLRRFFAS
jgi:hypothetical protein